MSKITFSVLLALLTATALLSACSDTSTDTMAEKPATTQSDDVVDLKTLIEQTEASRAEADKLGFEWSVTAPLLVEAHAAAKAGNEEQAIALFQEVKYQSMLAIEQAHYADKHWQLLVPMSN